eukprot:gb/GECG01005883.1/.p1 GENE.gb/GECG01005883.1/~~gb/GECG01005883.1/.p1  ORF type:complete len:139 (+),score=14.78 gb/GECG01005883.1/:1-417(+)
MSLISGGALTVRELNTFNTDVDVSEVFEVIVTGIFVTGVGLVALFYLYDKVSEENTQATWFLAGVLLTIIHFGQGYTESDSAGELAAQIIGMVIVAGGVILAYKIYSTEQATGSRHPPDGQIRQTDSPVEQLIAHDIQ